MVWEFIKDRPIYSQLIEQIALRIISGEYVPGSKLPSVRDLAAQASVNPNTMQRALTELEREGLVYAQRTSGRYITEDEGLISKIKQTVAMSRSKEYLQSMQALGYDAEQAVQMVRQAAKGEE